MNKKLIALALASAFAAPVAMADGVTMYGQVDMSVNSVDTDSKVVGADDRIGGVSSNNSRFGIKGSEDLGGELKGIWQFEQTLQMDGDANSSGTSSSFGSLRNTFLGLAGKSWGSVKLGNIDTPYKSSTSRLDMFADTYGDYNAIMGSITNGSNAFDVRQPSSVLYESPSFGGFSFAGMYGFRNEVASNTGNGANNDPQLHSAAISYINGPLFASLGYEVQKAVSFTGTSGNDRKAAKLGLGFNFGSLVLNGVYERISSDSALATSERNAWLLGAGYTIDKVVLKAQYAKADESDSVLGNDGAKYYAVGADYLLSKRTKVYALYTALDNDTNAQYTFGNATSDSFLSPAGGTKPSAFSRGVRHSF